jgi:hypothetical protein
MSTVIITDVSNFNISDEAYSAVSTIDVTNFSISDIASVLKVLKDTTNFSVSDYIEQIRSISDAILSQYAKYSYSELLTKFEDITTPAGRFVPDYYTLRYLEKEAMLDRGSVAMLAVALSNLLRLCVENEVDEIHFVSLRIRKLYYDELDKYFFVITDY